MVYMVKSLGAVRTIDAQWMWEYNEAPMQYGLARLSQMTYRARSSSEALIWNGLLG